MMRTTAVTILLLIAGPAFADGWLCIADGIVGFEYDRSSKTWKEQNYSPGNKYVIRRSKDANYAWEVVVFGENVPSYWCQTDFDKDGIVKCGEFRFDRDLLKFSMVTTWSYFRAESQLPKESDADSVALMIGKCSSI